ncbi:MAG: hypothetical protein WDN24_20850 [Sphingomonas sp.]
MTYDQTRRTSFDWGQLSDPALRSGARHHRRESHGPLRPAVPGRGGKRRRGRHRPALANAIADATGIRLRDLPLTPARLKAAIGPGG